MTAALIYIDSAAILPVIDGVWHRTRLSEIPAPGETIVMLCGLTASAAFEPMHTRRDHGVPTQCPHCDVQQRQHLGYEIRPDHPGLQPPARGQ